MDSPRRIIAQALRRDAALHEGGQLQSIGADFEATLGEIRPLEDRLERDVGIAIEFWDGWVDASVHDWQYYEGIARGDWPKLARAIATALEAGDPITEPIVLVHFAPENRRSLWSRLKGWFTGQKVRSLTGTDDHEG